MLKITLMLMLLGTFACAKTVRATYEVSFGIFQKLGIAETMLRINDDDTYVIHVEAKTLGWAKVLSNNRYERYESRGIVKNGQLLPLSYSTMRKTDSKLSQKTYTFDHPNRTVWKESFKRSRDGEDRYREKNGFYADEDILSLFFNLKRYTTARENTTFHAVGGNKEDGRIDAVFPKTAELERMKKLLGTREGEFVKVILNDRIFASEKGELLINLDRDGLCEKAILEDVLLFGDIVGKRIR